MRSDLHENNENLTFIILFSILLIVVIVVIVIIFNSNNELLNNISNYMGENTENMENNDNTTNDTNLNSTNDNKDENTNNPNVNEEENSLQNNNITDTKEEIEIATYTTTLYDKEQSRIDNINLATSKLNGKIIKKYEEFSFNNTIGPMDESNGFKKATGFDTNGKKIKMSGGGICQISSTLYNTALIANFNITERHPHSRRVYYVPKDKDATIFYGSLDLKFINTSDSDVKIVASNTESEVTIKLVKI